MSASQPASRGKALKNLLATPSLADLGPGPRPGVMPPDEVLRIVNQEVPALKVTAESADLIRSVLLLWHDHLEASHAISQSMHGPDGSYVHAIMHRREPDYGNSQYWFRRTGDHPCFAVLTNRASAFLREQGDNRLEERLMPQGKWDPFAFVDACEAVAGSPATHAEVKRLQEVQRIEFEVLLDYLIARR